MNNNRMTRSQGTGSSLKGFRFTVLPKPWSSVRHTSPDRSTDHLKSQSSKATVSRRLSCVERSKTLQIPVDDTNTGIKSKSWTSGHNYSTGPLSRHACTHSIILAKENLKSLSPNKATITVFTSKNNFSETLTGSECLNQRRESSPAVSHNGDSVQTETVVIDSETKPIPRAPIKKLTFSSRTSSDLGCNASSSEDDLYESRRERKPNRASTPDPVSLCSIAQELNSPILQRKLQKALTRRSKSENNFHKRMRKIRVDGNTYKLTMEPQNLRISQEEVKSPNSAIRTDLTVSSQERTPPNQFTRDDRSISLPGAEFINPSNRSRSDSLSSQEMRQAQKWVSEREELASQIDLSKPIRLPQTEDEKKEMNGNAENVELILPCVDRREALDCAALRLRRISQELESGNVSSQTLKETLQYAISVLEMKFLNRTSYSDDDSDADASFQGDSVVPPEIKRWLMQTFSTSGADGKSKRKRDRRTLRSVVHVMQAGMFVERMFRKSSAATNLNIPPEIQTHLKDIDKWQYDVFALESISGGNALKFTFYEVLSKYDFIRKYKISPKVLFAFADKLQIGYRKHNNRYHNPVHAADVTQCISVFLSESGFINWLSDLEVFAMIFAGAIHDLEHTGTTNNFHTQTRSNLALLYNDKSVLENHHVSAAFRILWEDRDCDILSSLSKEDYRQFRELVIEMVLATDMSLHFGQVKSMKAILQHPEKMERSKAMALMMHCADINHPTRPWDLHHRWTSRLLDEFFNQGDKERELQVPISPLCDRRTTMVAQSQIGFIDYVIRPTFEVLHDLFWKVSVSSIDKPPDVSKEQNGSATSRPNSATSSVKKIDSSLGRRYSEAPSTNKQVPRNNESLKKKIKDFKNMCNHLLKCNRQKWVVKDGEEQEAKKSEQTREQSSCSTTNSDNGSSTT